MDFGIANGNGIPINMFWCGTDASGACWREGGGDVRDLICKVCGANAVPVCAAFCDVFTHQQGVFRLCNTSLAISRPVNGCIALKSACALPSRRELLFLIKVPKKKHILSTLVFAGVLASAIPASATNWSGAYVGLSAGYDWTKNKDELASSDNGASWISSGAIPGSAEPDSSGVLGGLYAGYNFQTNNIVYGVEADFSGLDSLNSKTVQGSTVRTPTVKQNLTTLGTVRGRVGYSFLQNLLGFVSGGYAYGSGTLSTSIGNTGGCNGNYCGVQHLDRREKRLDGWRGRRICHDGFLDAAWRISAL